MKVAPESQPSQIGKELCECSHMLFLHWRDGCALCHCSGFFPVNHKLPPAAPEPTQPATELIPEDMTDEQLDAELL